MISDENVGVCYRHGVTEYKDTGGDTFRVWLGEFVVTADSGAGLLLDQPSSVISWKSICF